MSPTQDSAADGNGRRRAAQELRPGVRYDVAAPAPRAVQLHCRQTPGPVPNPKVSYPRVGSETIVSGSGPTSGAAKGGGSLADKVAKNLEAKGLSGATGNPR
jgi:hypothetical protein